MTVEICSLPSSQLRESSERSGGKSLLERILMVNILLEIFVYCSSAIYRILWGACLPCISHLAFLQNSKDKIETLPSFAINYVIFIELLSKRKTHWRRATLTTNGQQKYPTYNQPLQSLLFLFINYWSFLGSSLWQTPHWKWGVSPHSYQSQP